MVEQKTHLFLLENEIPSSENPDVNPYRCSYCGELAIISRDEDGVPMNASHNCEDAMTELTLREEFESLSRETVDKQSSLDSHIQTKIFDEDTRIMRFEDELKSLKERYGIADEGSITTE